MYHRTHLVLAFLVPAMSVVVGFSSQHVAAQVPTAQVVLFTPSDVKPPPKTLYEPRLDLFGRYAEQFFNEGMKRWGYAPARKEIFLRDEAGAISVVHVRGDLPAAGDAYKKKWISNQVHEKLKTEHGTKIGGNLYWIFVYVGDPPKKHDGYRGAGNSKDGGWAVLNYPNVRGKVSLKDPPVSPFHDKLTLKGCIHEFGHALGLSHIGPKVELGMGNTLMGPINRIYASNKMPDRTKAYLSEANAAILSTHPIFTGNAKARQRLPATSFQRLAKSYDRKSHSVTVSGSVATNGTIHRVIVIDDRNDKIGAYWVKAFVTVVDERGRFTVKIANPGPRGSHKFLAVYENGAVTGDGKKRGIGSAAVNEYSLR